MTDLCWVCRRNNTKISCSTNLTVEVKAELIAEQNHPPMFVTTERFFYQSCVEESKCTAEALGITMLEPSPSYSKPETFHDSFDYAQQVHLPSNPLQSGPVYFLVAEYSVSAVKPSPPQVLIDEGMCRITVLERSSTYTVIIVQDKIKTTCPALFGLESNDPPALTLHAPRPYKICSRLVFWSPKETL
ncbi:hypothetical protein RRG08_011659 [Elysia crispata]|uniref:Uncharacterized protein n=1 Tax=Elysia crispata TaxID=231223 RepID=A0AAE0YK36_9GAST|nr:hypothetical protein RRG08_011659 [Elysia crispata]